MAEHRACGSCGTGLRDSAKFCDECGAATATSGDTAKYRQVTVLFADVVRSMDIAATLDIERLRELMTDLVQRSTAVVQRYGGTVEYNGDGVMALFGAPIALEDHAFRACLAALAIQEEANRLATEVQQRDGIDLQLRVGLNSGRVIAGEIGSGAKGYVATGQPVGFAQRMESVAPPGTVMLAESTVRLVEHTVQLSEPELVHVKGSDEPVQARQLLAINSPDGLVHRAEAALVGRRWEMAALDAMVDRATNGRGSVVTLVGPPGIGKSRVAREVAARAGGRGLDVYWAFCESHARDISFGLVAQLLRAGADATDLHGDAARAAVRAAVPADAGPQDLLLLDDLLGVADPETPLPQMDPDARRRRLTALINATSLARTQPALFIIEDAHWIDAVSESMLTDFLTVIARTPIVVLITYRPEYREALTRVPGAQTIALAPLDDSDTAALLGELLGTDGSIAELASIITDRAAGNPFFTEEMVRELVQRGALAGARGNYVCSADIDELSVPATVQAAIAARVDRLSSKARQTLDVAAVIGARFGAQRLAALSIDPVVDELLDAELIDQVRFTPTPEYAFHHPLIRAVAYESQLKSDRAEWHRRLAVTIESDSPESADQNAALIAEHLQAAGEMRSAYDWHMRAGRWSANRDVGAARISWERACEIADQLPDGPDHLSMRIAPRSMLCATRWQALQEGRDRVEELRTLCAAAGDMSSLAIGMTGVATELVSAGRSPEGARLMSEQMALLDSIGDPTIIGLAFIGFNNWFDSGDFGEVLRWSQVVIDLAQGDPFKGGEYGFGSPLAGALAWRGIGRWWTGQPEWRRDLFDAFAMAQQCDPTTLAMIVGWTHGVGIRYGVLRSDDSALHAIERALQTAEGSSNIAFSIVRFALAAALMARDADADRDRGLELLEKVRDAWVHEPIPFLIPFAEFTSGPERAKRGDRDSVISVLRNEVAELRRVGRPFFGVLGVGVLVEALLDRGAEGDPAEAEEAIAWLAELRPDQRWAIRDIWLLRLRAAHARARGDHDGYREWATRYQELAESLGFEGHIAWAAKMVAAR